ncbi:MAG TPA: PQQ-binding-like beta-propeller repeat protein [Solirubrobacteraceae bacterium]|jgi:outer membrane protein assembly factor BamB
MASLLARTRSLPVAAFVVGLALLAVPAAASASSSDQAVAYQLDPTHDGFQTADPITAPLSQAWSIDLFSPVSYPLIVNGTVYVTAGGVIYALSQATGSTLWTYTPSPTHNPQGLTYDAGQILTVTQAGTMLALDATTGALDWSVVLPSQSSFSSPVSTGNGLAYTVGAGSGGTMYAVSEATGALAWESTNIQNGDDSTPAVSPSGVYVTFSCDQDYDLNPWTGLQIWHNNTDCDGGGGEAPVLANGDLYGLDSLNGNVALAASTGTSAGSFSATEPPAVGGGVGYLVDDGQLSAAGSSGLGTSNWTFSGASNITTPPLVVGNLVFVASATGEVYAVNTADGSSAWSASAGSSGPDAGANVDGLAAGENTVIVPSGDNLVAYAGANVGTGTPANAVAPAVAGTPVAGEPLGADVGVWNALPTGYTYQWSLCDSAGSGCNPISSGGTGESYTPPSSDIGDTLEVAVAATNGTGTSTAVTSALSSPIVEAQPVNTSAPSISGSAIAGQQLSASTGTWSNSPTIYSYQWLRCQTTCSDIAGATSSTYTVNASDGGTDLEVQISASNATGTSTLVDSAATAKIPIQTTVTLTASPNPASTGSIVTLTASVSPTVTAGTLTFTQNGQSIPGCPPFTMTAQLIDVSCVGPFEQAGTYIITATFSGYTGYTASSASLTQTITGASTPTSTTPVGVVIKGFPSSLVNSPVINYSESGPVTSTTCTLDGGPTSCSSTQASFTDLAPGQHTFAVTVSGGDSSAVSQISWEITTSTQVAKVTGKKSKSAKKPKKKKKKKKPGSHKSKKHRKKKTKKHTS